MQLFKWKILFGICLFLSFDSTYAQVLNANYYNDSSKLIITKYVYLLKDEKVLTIDSVNTFQAQKRFTRSKDRPAVFNDYDPYYYWFRFVIRNNDSIPKDLMLLMAPVGMRDGQLYQRNKNHWKVIAKNGYKYPFLERAYQYANYVFPFTLPPKTLDTLYLSMDASHAFKSYGFAIMNPVKLKLLENRVYLLFGIIVGLLTLFCLFNLFLFFTLKLKIHLWYSLYIGMLILIVMKNDQLDQQFFGWDSEKAYTMTSIMGIAALSIAILMHVIQQFLVNIKKNHYLYTISFVAKINVLLSGFAQLITFYIKPDSAIQSGIFKWSNYSTILAIVIIIIDCIYSIYKGNKSAYFIIGGLFLYLIGAIQRLLLIGLPSYFFPPYIFHYGMVTESFIISFGLIFQYRLERLKKYKNIKEGDDLKNSRDKLLLESKIQIQEQTIKTTFQEIRNNIAQNINLVKQNIAYLKLTPADSTDSYLGDSKRLISMAIIDLRNLCKSLDTDYVRDIGLLKSIEVELERCKKGGACNSNLEITGEIYRIDSKKELILFRIYQEILNNIKKRALGNSIHVFLNYKPDLFELIITYEGQIPEAEPVEESNNNIDLDISNLNNRANLIGATFTINTKIRASNIIIRLPIAIFRGVPEL